LLETVQARRRREGTPLIVMAQHTKYLAQLHQRVATDLLDRSQRLSRGPAPLAEHPGLHAGLDDHGGDVVREKVVLLYGDPGALPRHSQPSHLFNLILPA